MTVDGWIPVNPLTLETAFPGVYAVGDVTSVGTPKAGVFAEGQASGCCRRDRCPDRGTTGSARYDGHGMCYLEFGRDQVAPVDVTFSSGEHPEADSKDLRKLSPPTRSSSGRAGSSAGSVARGPQWNPSSSEGTVSPVPSRAGPGRATPQAGACLSAGLSGPDKGLDPSGITLHVRKDSDAFEPLL